MSVLNSVDVCIRFSNRTGPIMPRYYIILWNKTSSAHFRFLLFLAIVSGT